MNLRKPSTTDKFVVEHMISKFVKQNLKIMDKEKRKHQTKCGSPLFINRKLSENKIEKGTKRQENIQRPYKSPIIINKLEQQCIDKNQHQSQNKKNRVLSFISQSNKPKKSSNIAKASYLKHILEQLKTSKQKKKCSYDHSFQQINNPKQHNSIPITIKHVAAQYTRTNIVRASLKTLPSQLPNNKKNHPSLPQIEQRICTEISGWSNSDGLEID